MQKVEGQVSITIQQLDDLRIKISEQEASIKFLESHQKEVRITTEIFDRMSYEEDDRRYRNQVLWTAQGGRHDISAPQRKDHTTQSVTFVGFDEVKDKLKAEAEKAVEKEVTNLKERVASFNLERDNRVVELSDKIKNYLSMIDNLNKQISALKDEKREKEKDQTISYLTKSLQDANDTIQKLRNKKWWQTVK